jgi:hypothetical protein
MAESMIVWVFIVRLPPRAVKTVDFSCARKLGNCVYGNCAGIEFNIDLHDRG